MHTECLSVVVQLEYADESVVARSVPFTFYVQYCAPLVITCTVGVYGAAVSQALLGCSS